MLAGQQTAGPTSIMPNGQFLKIPDEMKSFRQWICWNAVAKPDGKVTKIPINATTGKPASVTNPNDWSTFDEACANAHKASGIGFVFTSDDPFAGIDLDDTHGDAEAYARQVKIYEAFDSYSELSPSGHGLHIIVKGAIPIGRRRAAVEIYSAGRFFTMTGNAFRAAPIAERQELLTTLFDEMGGTVQPLAAMADKPETQSDSEILYEARKAANGAKFESLYRGEWSGIYPSQSEADQALTNIIGFYAKNQAQIARIFRGSALGQRDKAKRDDYVGNMVRKALDRELAPVPFGDAFRAAQAVQASTGSATPAATTFWPPAVPTGAAWLAPTPISESEFFSAKAAPDTIIPCLYYADVGVFIAPGGTGKTTSILYQAAHIALGRELWGMPVLKPGVVLILTAEDSREMLVARLRSICGAMELTRAEIQTVAGNVLISDVSGSGLKLTEIERDVVRPAHIAVEQIIAACHILRPVLIVIDPAISFGVGESRVNDAEQGLVEVGRRLRRALNCCVLFIHHTGKQNARDKAVDQYSGRGGSAFADGARMVMVLQNMAPADWLKGTGQELQPGETGLILARPKMSYAPPQPSLFIRRKGYSFDHVEPAIANKDAQRQLVDDNLHALLIAELAAGRLHTGNTIESADTGLKRTELRAALHRLESAGLIERRDRPGEALQRGARNYLHPIAHDKAEQGP